MKTYIATGETYRNRHVFETWQWVWYSDKNGWILVDEDYMWSVEAVRLIPGIKLEETEWVSNL